MACATTPGSQVGLVFCFFVFFFLMCFLVDVFYHPFSTHVTHTHTLRTVLVKGSLFFPLLVHPHTEPTHTPQPQLPFSFEKGEPPLGIPPPASQAHQVSAEEAHPHSSQSVFNQSLELWDHVL